MPPTTPPPSFIMDAVAAPLSPVPPVTDSANVALAQLVDEALELDQVIDSYKESLKAAQERYDKLRKVLIPDAMRQAGLVDASGHGSFSHRSGAKLHLRHDLNAYVLAADKPKLFAWLREDGHGDLIREEVHSSTLRAFCKERVEDGATLPPWVQLSPETVAIIKVPKAKGEQSA